MAIAQSRQYWEKFEMSLFLRSPFLVVGSPPNHWSFATYREYICDPKALLVLLWMSHIPVDIWKYAMASPRRLEGISHGICKSSVSVVRERTHNQPETKRESPPIFWE